MYIYRCIQAGSCLGHAWQGCAEELGQLLVAVAAPELLDLPQVWCARFRGKAFSRSRQEINEEVPTPPNVPLLRALWPLFDGMWGILEGSWGVLVYVYVYMYSYVYMYMCACIHTHKGLVYTEA